MFNLVEAFTHEGLAIMPARRLRAINVIEALADLFVLRGCPPATRRAGSGPETRPRFSAPV